MERGEEKKIDCTWKNNKHKYIAKSYNIQDLYVFEGVEELQQ